MALQGHLWIAVNVFVFVVIFSSVTAKIKFRDDIYEPRVVSLSDGEKLEKELNRIRRESSKNNRGKMGVSDSHVEVHVNTFKNKNHKQAVVHWSGSDSNAIFLLTREVIDGVVNSSSLYRSLNYGVTFDEITPQNSVISSFFVDPNNYTKLIFADRKNRAVYVTDDEGKTLSGPHRTQFNPQRLVFNPILENVLLGYSYTQEQLFVSRDLGKTWKKLQDGADSRFFWFIPGVDTNNLTVHMEIADPVTGQMHYKTCIIEWTESDNVHCSPLTDLSSALGTIAVESLVVQNEYIFVQKNTQRSAEMYVSYRRQPFKKAYFPQGLESVEFELYDTDEHQVFVAVRHWTDVLNLYLSDITGQYFVLSLENVVTMDFGTFSFSDLIEIKSTPGVFLSNVRTTYGIVTMVTYDKGGNWSRLAAADPKCRLPDCSLNLHMMYSSFKYSIPQGIFSKKNAPGIIIGLGNEDGYLNMQSKSNSYISRDGGHTWTKLLSGNYQFNILDQGGALMAVQPGVYTRHIQYSTDVGATWKPVTLNVSLMIDGLLNEPGITTLVSSAYGHHQTGDYGWVVIQFNLTGAFSGKCTDKNYEHWSPGGEHACTLGERAVYQRRKQNADCYNGQDYERPINSSVCTCTVEDFECDYGYENQAGQCVVAAWYDQSPVEDCPVGTKYSKSSGYRKVAADKCKGGVEDDKKYKPTMTDCPVLPPGDMRLESSATTGATTTGTNVTFYFRQGKGSKTTTHYNCTFGDGHQQSMLWNDTTPGVMKFTHQFLKAGTYHVTVQATNQKGQASVALPLTVEDRIVDLEVELPRGALQNEPSVFTAIPVFGLDNGNTQDLKQTHFIWQFSHQETPTLSWNGTVSFKYSEPGNYTAHVTAVNAVSSYHKALTVRVYGELVVVQLWFENLPLEVPPSLLINRIIFRRSFEKAVVKEISEKKILGTEVGEIQAAMLLKEPLRVDVVILPPTVNKNKITATQVAQKLIDAVAAHNLSIPLGSIDTVTPTKAVIVKDSTPGGSSHKRNLVPVFVAVPVAVITVLVMGLIVIYYRKKFVLNQNAYRLLRANEQADRLLDSPDEDDDDPMLDSGPAINTAQRTEEDDAVPAFGDDSRLEIRTGSTTDSGGNNLVV